MQRLLHGGRLPYTAKMHSGLHEYLVALDQRPHLAPPDPVPAEITPPLSTRGEGPGVRRPTQ
jgi:hypothetical protein